MCPIRAPVACISHSVRAATNKSVIPNEVARFFAFPRDTVRNLLPTPTAAFRPCDATSLRLRFEGGTPGGIRTPDLLVRSQTLYPAELRARNWLNSSTVGNTGGLRPPKHLQSRGKLTPSIMFFVYLLRSQRTGRLYVGFTSDVAHRLGQHNQDVTKSTKGQGPWELVYQERFETRAEAMRRERFFKSGQGREALRLVGRPGTSWRRFTARYKRLP